MYTPRHSSHKASIALLGFAALSFAIATPSAAQVSFAPTIGVYIPTQELVNAATGQSFKQQVSISVGGRLGLWFGDRIGLETSAAYAPSTLRFSADGSDFDEDANVLTGSGQLRVMLIPTTSIVSIGVSGGVSLTSRGGDAFSATAATSDVGGVLGGTVAFRAGPLFRLVLTAEDYLYQATFTGLNATEQRMQHDIHLNFGFGIPLIGLGS